MAILLHGPLHFCLLTTESSSTCPASLPVSGEKCNSDFAIPLRLLLFQLSLKGPSGFPIGEQALKGNLHLHGRLLTRRDFGEARPAALEGRSDLRKPSADRTFGRCACNGMQALHSALSDEEKPHVAYLSGLTHQSNLPSCRGTSPSSLLNLCRDTDRLERSNMAGVDELLQVMLCIPTFSYGLSAFSGEPRKMGDGGGVQVCLLGAEIEALKGRYLTWQTRSSFFCVTMANRTSHRSPRKCLTDVGASWQALFLFVPAFAGKTNHSLSNVFRENKQICKYMSNQGCPLPGRCLCAVERGGLHGP